MKTKLFFIIISIFFAMIIEMPFVGYCETMIVTSSDDSGFNTLRAAIAASNSTTGKDSIVFSISNSITVFSAISITDPVIIEGSSVTIGATGSSSGIDILVLDPGSSTSAIKNMVLVSSQHGIRINSGSGSNQITGCVIGTDYSDDGTRANETGIGIFSSSNNIIGGIIGSERNVISGNTAYGIELVGTCDSNSIVGNYIGVNIAGTATIGIQPRGIRLNSTVSNTLIGGLVAGARNIISGNTWEQIRVMNTLFASNNRIVGNYISTNVSGTALISGGTDGIYCDGSDSLWIEGNTLAQSLYIRQWTGGANNQAVANTIVANRIGVFTDGSSVSGLGNGIWLYGASHNFIGFPVNGEGNLVGNATNGIQIQDGSGGVSINNGLYGNTLVSNSDAIVYISSTQKTSVPLPLYAAENSIVTGTANPDDYIEVFKTSTGDNSLRFVGSTITDSFGNWSFNPGFNCLNGELILATAKAANQNTSDFSGTIDVTDIAPSPTISATVTITPTITVTPTVTMVLSTTATSTPAANASVTMTSTGAMIPDTKLEVLAYPNPAKDSIRFYIKDRQAGDVLLSLYNLIGEKVGQVTESYGTGQVKIIEWQCGQIAPGIYIAQIMIGSKKKVNLKVVVIK